MKKPFVAHTQHNEMNGTIALDGKSNMLQTLRELGVLCKVPDGYCPLGFHLSGVQHDNGLADFHIAAIEGTFDDYVEYLNGHKNRKLEVVRFGGKINLSDLPKYFKMLSIFVTYRSLEGRKVVYDPNKDVDNE